MPAAVRSGPLARALAVWLAILVCAMANGALREAVLVPAWGRVPAQVASGLLLSAAILLAAVVAVRWIVRQAADGWALGALWLVLTVAFEFGLGRLVMHKSWPELFGAYTFEGGNLWPLVLAVTFLAPPLVTRLLSHRG